MKTIITASQGWILHSVRATKLHQIPLRASIFAISLAVFATSVASAFADDKSQGSGPAVVKTPSYSVQITERGVSQTPITPERTGALHPVETNPAFAYVPSYRMGLRWRN